MNELTICGGSGGRFGSAANPWGNVAGGRGACITLTGGRLTELVRSANYVVVGNAGTNTDCGGGTLGGGGGGLSGLFVTQGNDAVPVVVAGGGGGGSVLGLSCDAVLVSGGLPIPGSSSLAAVDRACTGSNTGQMFGAGGMGSDVTAVNGSNGSGYPLWNGGDFTEISVSRRYRAATTTRALGRLAAMFIRLRRAPAFTTLRHLLRRTLAQALASMNQLRSCRHESFDKPTKYRRVR